MLASRSRASTISRSRLRYVCPECQSNALLSAFLDTTSTSKKTTLHKRFFITLNRHDASVVPSQPLLDISNSVIRNHLRSWTVENQKKKKAEAEKAGSDSNKLRRLAALPNSMFIEEANSSNGTLADDEAAGGDEADESWEDGVTAGWNEAYEPGDLIWWRPGPNTTFVHAQPALYLGTSGWQRQYMLGDGRWVVEKSRVQSSPTFKKFASHKEIDEVRKYLPVKPLESNRHDYDPEIVVGFSFAGDIPASVAEPLVARFAQLVEDMSSWRRENLALLDSLYDRIADEERYISLRFPEVVTKLLGIEYSKVAPAALLTIFRTLRRKFVSVVTVHKSPYYPSATVSLTPKRLARNFEQVCTWAREYQESAAAAAMGKDVTARLELNPLSAFVAKARRLILKSRTHRSPTTIGSLGPSSIQGRIQGGELPRKDNEETFSENDKLFIEFLWDCYVRHPTPDNNRNMAIASLVLRAVGAYPKLRLDKNMGRLLLQELGTLQPWSLRSDHNVNLELPHGRASSELKRIYAAAETYCKESGIAASQNAHILKDSMASLRQDLGALPVYCVDVGEAVIREDGFSVEPNPEIPGTYWIHGHTSHPSAFFDQHHIFGQRARLLAQSIFHHNRVARIFPEKYCTTMSLKPNAPALTVSTLLTEDGRVLDVKIRPTTLRNVTFLSNPAVEQLLNRPQYEAATLTLGISGGVDFEAMGLPAPNDIEKAREHLPTIQLLEKLLLAREDRRQKEVTVVPDWKVHGSLSTMSYAYVFGSRYYEGDLFRTQQYEGDPALRIKSTRYMKSNRVSEMAKSVTLTALLGDLVSESAGKWFGDRKIPAIYFGSSYAPDYPPERLNGLKRGEKGEYPSGKLSSSPIPHVHKSHKSHLWLSNPLRRYPDLMAHWNADAYLRAEVDGLVEPGQPGDKLELPFSAEQCNDFISYEAPKMYEWALNLARNEKKHWVIQALFRAFHFKEVELPEVWDLNVSSVVPNKSRPDDSGLRGVLLPFQIFAHVLSSKEGWEKGVKLHSFLPVKLELVDTEKQYVVVRVAGPPSEEYTQPGPIHLAPKKPLYNVEDGVSKTLVGDSKNYDYALKPASVGA